MANGEGTFLVLGMPRCRTTWLSQYLSFGGWRCGHDESRFLRTITDIKAWGNTPMQGSTETFGGQWWRAIAKWLPETHVVCVWREPKAVWLALRKQGLDVPLTWVERQAVQLERAARKLNAPMVAFADLDNPAMCEALAMHCIGQRPPREWTVGMQALNIQCDLMHLRRYAQANQPAMQQLADNVKGELLCDLTLKASNGVMTVGLETDPDFFSVVSDSRFAITAHLANVGDGLVAEEAKDWALMAKAYAEGRLQIVNAKVNGKVVGYLLTLVSPSVEQAGKLTAVDLAFYASPHWTGAGRAMERESIRILRERGVSELIMRAGIRADGPRLGALYRRLGAEPFGQLYRLGLES